MGSDIARKTADAAQQYRAVVWQQGRVTLETDLNEAEEMRAEQSHAQLLDIVGPAGTPDDGYRVSVPATSGIPYDFSIGFGTFYMGGVRVSRAAATSWFGQQQGDWLDLAAELQDQPEREQVLLWLQEQEVSAVEDAALREEALGGPDTAQRLRLLQRVLRQPVEADDCAGAFGEIAQRWAKEGLVLDQATRRLGSAARLKAGFQQPGGSMSPCEPQAQGGFLGAENQLIRVQVTAGSKILWGFDNASFLYRVTPVGGSKKVLRLGSVPVDAQHQPRTGQYVEVLRPTALLANGELVAAPSGHVSKLSGGYDPDAETVQLETSLPAGYLEAEQLYLRVWEEQKQFDENVPLTLGDTGLQVTLSGGPFPLGDHWLLAVRPSQPQRVYPARYLEEPQPPDGPRCWATPLALLNWKDEDTAEVVDCRPAFDNLVELTARPLAQPGSSGGGCCSVIIGPEDLVGESLQEIIDRYSREYRPAVICLRTGRYELEEPLRLGKEHDGLALHGCTGEVVLAAAEGKEESFADGLVVIYGTKEITLSSLRFELPAAPLDLQALGMDEAAARELQRALDEQGAGLYVSIGVQVAKTSGLTIEGCVFGYSSKKGLVFAVGVLLRGGAEALRVEGCQFLESKSQQGSE
ncbi:MAG: hypothetical protein FJ125_10750, partial [Deltaproteobacteria bacterium]|nr:hypothetical protein [Deltaproteobacteria bacterium]